MNEAEMEAIERRRNAAIETGVNPNCDFTVMKLDDGWYYFVCRKCGTRRLGQPGKPHYVRACAMWYKGLGNRITSVLGKAGITKSRWARFIGKPCRCKERQELLNKLLPWL